MNTVLLVSVNRCDDPYPVFPLGLAYIAAAVRKAGYHPIVHDMNIEPDGLEKTVRESNPEVVGLSLRNIDNVNILHQTRYDSELISVTERIRSVCSAPIVLGGSGFSLFPRQLLSSSQADYGIVGAGETSLVLLLDTLSSRATPLGIPGLVRKSFDEIIVTDQRNDSDALVVQPERSVSAAEFYSTRGGMLNIQTQRGCAYRCGYCTYPLIEGRTFRRFPPEKVCDDIERSISVGAKYFFVVDSVFNTSESHVVAVCEEILKRNIDIQWGCFLRPGNITRATMELMARAGLTHIEFGTDSLSDAVLDAYGKDFTFEDVYNTSRLAQRAKIRHAHFLIMGGPEENPATIDEALANAERISRTVFFPFSGMRIYPGTDLYKRALAEGVITSESDLLHPVFYFSPEITFEWLESRMKEFRVKKPNWVYGGPSPELRKVMLRLRSKGVAGPLWEFQIR